MSDSVSEMGRGSFRFLRVPVSQNGCFIEVKLSVFGVYWVSVIAPSRPPGEQPVQDFATRNENFDDVFIICYRKIYIYFWTQWNLGGIEIFQNQGGKEKRGKGGFLKY